MAKKRPSSHETHNNDWYAIRHLKSIFPEHWKINKLEDVFSGIEYGQDWLVLLTDEQNTLTGAEFRIQSKSLRGKLSKHSIKTKIKVSTLNYLADLSLPVLLHYYHSPSDIGYWMWLKPWYVENYSSKWEQKEEITVNIPLTNKLNLASIKQIKAFVEGYHSEHNLFEKIKVVSELDPDFKIEFSSSGTHLIQPKHESTRSFQLIFPNQEAARAAIEAYETGLAKTTGGKIEFGDALGKLVEETVGQNGEITFKPAIPNKDHFFEISFVDQDEQISYKSNPIRMRFLQLGTKVASLQGQFTYRTQIVTIKLTFDTRVEEIGFNFTFDRVVDDPEGIDDQLRLLEIAVASDKVVLTNLEDPERPIINSSKKYFNLDPIVSEIERRLIKALAIIKSQLKVSLSIPHTFTNKTLDLVEALAEGLLTGSTTHLIGISDADGINLELEFVDPQQALNLLEQDGGGLEIGQPGPKEIDFNGVSLKLGDTQYIFRNLKLRNTEDVIKKLRNKNNIVRFELEIDKNNSCIKFLDWPQSS